MFSESLLPRYIPRISTQLPRGGFDASLKLGSDPGAEWDPK